MTGYEKGMMYSVSTSCPFLYKKGLSVMVTGDTIYGISQVTICGHRSQGNSQWGLIILYQNQWVDASLIKSFFSVHTEH